MVNGLSLHANLINILTKKGRNVLIQMNQIVFLKLHQLLHQLLQQPLQQPLLVPQQPLLVPQPLQQFLLVLQLVL